MNKSLVKLLAGAAVASVLTTAANAGGGYVNIDVMRQRNWGPVYAITYLTADWVGGNLRASSTAVGNNISLSTEGSTFTYLNQVQLADVGAELSAHVGNVAGDVDLSSTAICNNISASTKKANAVHFESDQRCETEDPYAITNAIGYQIGGDFVVSAASVANNAAFVAESASTNLHTVQVNPAIVSAVVNAEAYNIGGNVDVSATAIGNNVSLNHSFGGTP